MLRLEAIEARLHESKAPLDGTAKVDVRAMLQNENDVYTRDVQARILKLHHILSDPRFDGKVQLGIDPKKIAWRDMSHVIAECFKPEFTKQAEGITAFYIRPVTHMNPMREAIIEIKLYRLNRLWSSVSAGAFVDGRDNARSLGIIRAYSVAPQAQPKSARDMMAIINAGIWKDMYKSDTLKHLTVSLASLKEADMLLDFTAGVLERQLTPLAVKARKPAGS